MTINSLVRQIVAMGGGGFSMEPENLLLDQYILGLVNKEKPKVCFVPTASGDAEDYIERFYGSFAELPCTPCHLSLFKPPTADIKSFVLEQDIIYVGGGNTKNLIALWKEWGLNQILRDAWESGIILCGLSAGSICWFEEAESRGVFRDGVSPSPPELSKTGVTDSIPNQLTVLKCIGLLKGSNCPHYDGEIERRPAYHRLLSEELIGEGYAADDGVALHFIADKLEKIVSSRQNAKAYRLEKIGDTVRETRLEPTYLGA